MALKHGSEHYTKLLYFENGQVMTRRIHRLEIQDARGQIHTIMREQLPEALIVSNREAKEGRNVAQILLRPESVSDVDWHSLGLFPTALMWNAFMFGSGFAFALLLRYLARGLVNF